MGKHAIYLMFNGNCEEAMNYYRDNLGGTISFIQRFSDTPEQSNDYNKDKIMHMSMDLQGFTIMASDAGDTKQSVTFGNNFSISLDFDSDGELRRVYDRLSAGGQATMPVQDTFWGATFGMCTDKFGINWMVNYDKPKV